MKAAILAYHSQNVAGSETGNNDHVALAADLEALHKAGVRFISLETLINGLLGNLKLTCDHPLVCLTFDDGCDFDFRTLDFPGFGEQTGFLQIMEQFVEKHGKSAQPGMHATSFVIADPEARESIDRKSLFAKGHMSDDWWREAQGHPLLSIANHGWDHNHPDLAEGPYARGSFAVVKTREHCHQQVVTAAEFIEMKTGRYPVVFAYPFGESSTYIREEYFPSHQRQHRNLAATGTDAGMISESSDRWNLPRFVCGRDWSAPDALLRLLSIERGDLQG